ncbi:ParM/StbA family protein [Nitrospira sp. Kam-Ns4a]
MSDTHSSPPAALDSPTGRRPRRAHGGGPGSTGGGRTAPSLAVGLDVGYAYLKVLTSRGERWLLPTAVAPVDLDDALWTGPSAVPAPAGDPPASFPTRVRLPDGAAYVLGDAAIWSGRRLLDHLRWDQWWQSIPYQALLRAVAAVLPPRAVVVTGLPLHLALADSARAAVAACLTSLLRAQTVSFVPQGIAAALALEALQSQEQVAVLDIGGRTTEFVTIVHGQIQVSRSTGMRLGVGPIYEAVAAQYRACGEGELDAYVVEQAARGDCPLHRVLPGLTQTALLEHLRVAAKATIGTILAKCRELWGDGRRLDRVILCGGGAALLAPWLTEWRADLQVAPDALWLNAQGYLRVAQTLLAAATPPASAASPAPERSV